MDEIVPTHIVSFYGVRCFWHSPTNTLWGTNWLSEQLIGVAAWFHNFMTGFALIKSPGFPLRIIADCDSDGRSLPPGEGRGTVQ